MTEPNANNLLEAAKWYLGRGFRPIPIPAGEKAPRIRGWTKLRLGKADLQQHFNGLGNIGLLMGEPSGWLVDIDLDCPEAIELAPQYLPPTPAKSGRASALNSHWWYICPHIATKKHALPGTRQPIVEIRSTGAQTIVGPSMHPSGERYGPLEGEPAAVKPEVLTAAVRALVDAVIERCGGVAKRPAPPPRAPTSGRSSSCDTVLKRAAAYLDAMPPAISGQSGHNATYAAATAMVHGFDLDSDAAFGLLRDRYNSRCQPPWSEKELQHKVEDAAGKPHNRPLGWLRDAKAADAQDVDLSSFGPLSEPTVGDEQSTRPERPPDPGPFPDDLLCVPGFINKVMAYNLATATRAQPVLALAAGICLQSVLCGRKVRDERGNRTNLYCVGVASSGAGKDHARKVNKNVLFASGLVEHEGNEDLASDAGLVTAVEAEPAILFQIDEFGRFLRTIGDPKKAPHLFNVLTVLMKLYSSADTIFKGKAYADKKRNKVINQPCVSVYGTTVPEHFFASLTADSLSDGFIARLLVFETDSTPPRQRVKATPIPEEIIMAARWWGEFRPSGNLRNQHPEPLVVPVDDEAGLVFDALAELVDRELARDQRGRSLWARAEEKACRLALIYACSANHERPVIDHAAAKWACDVSEYLTRRMLHVAHEWVAEGNFDARQKRVMRIVRRAGGRISRSVLCRKTQWLTLRERQEVIDNLLETGQLEQVVEKTATKPGVIYALV